MTSPKISIVVPCYNVEGYLGEFHYCMQSILSQTLKEIEILLVDNGSSDCTGALLEEYRRDDPRVRVFSLPENLGHAGGRNHGILHARGKYVFIPDADDWLHPGLCEKTYAAAELHEAELVIFYADFTEWGWDYLLALPQDGSKTLETLEQKAMSLHSYHAHWNKLMQTDFLLEKGIQFPDRYYDDHYFSWAVTVLARKIAVVRDKLYWWRKRETSVTNTKIASQTDVFEAHELIRRMLLDSGTYPTWKTVFLNYKWRGIWGAYHFIASKNEDHSFDDVLQTFLLKIGGAIREEDVELLNSIEFRVNNPHLKAWFDRHVKSVLDPSVLENFPGPEPQRICGGGGETVPPPEALRKLRTVVFRKAGSIFTAMARPLFKPFRPLVTRMADKTIRRHIRTLEFHSGELSRLEEQVSECGIALERLKAERMHQQHRLQAVNDRLRSNIPGFRQ